MTLGELIDSLTEGHLRGTGMVEDDQTLDPSFRPTLIGHVNKGLTRLYTRFCHEKAFLTLELQEGIHTYHLSKLHAVTDATSGNDRVRYIKDTEAEPYDGNLIKILGIQELGVDDTTLEDSPDGDSEMLIASEDSRRDRVKMMTYNKFYIRTVKDKRLLRVEYQRRHVPIDSNASDDVEIVLFPTLEEALEMYIAGRVYTGIGGEQNMLKGSFNFKEYERLCQMSKADDMTADSESNQSHRFANSGLS